MGNRTAKFISALVGSIIAGVPLAAVSQNAPAVSSTASAASDCLASAKGTAPQGQHWYYRLDRATKRQCWYLRAEGGKVTQSAQATDTPDADSAASPSVQNARAEYIAPQTAPNVTAPALAAASAPLVEQQPSSTVTDSNAEQPAVAARWPDASATAAAAQPSAKPAKPAAAPVALAAAEIPADKPTGSLQMLLLVIGGALALAGLLASIIYRFAGGRVRAKAGDHRRVNWDDREPHDLDDSRAPWLEATPAVTPRAQRPHPIDFDAVRSQATRPQAPQLAAFSNEIGRIAAQSRSPRDEVAVDLDEAAIFDGEFEIERSAPRLAVNATQDEEPVDDKPVDRNEDVQTEDAVDIDIITAMLERLAQEGPRLSRPDPDPSLDSSPGAALVDLARTPRGQSAARA
ncbi:hypothetical protein [Bradyrhizobium betae]|uniref:Secreted protein n=1 Tax=Bradyrhizobium betae TaxID=244734 RepID=A0A4Q1UTU7_9BRAD|nr:hypothetical protein [Bradyrhizobium betae]RXT41958.1 hypothetical protein B5V03_26000 [Bradyrhizobium betae]